MSGIANLYILTVESSAQSVEPKRSQIITWFSSPKKYTLLFPLKVGKLSQEGDRSYEGDNNHEPHEVIQRN